MDKHGDFSDTTRQRERVCEVSKSQFWPKSTISVCSCMPLILVQCGSIEPSRGFFWKQLKSTCSSLSLLRCQPPEVFVLRCCWQTEPSPLSVLHDTVSAWVNMTWLLFQSGIMSGWATSHTATMTAGIKVNHAKDEGTSSLSRYRALTVYRM